MIVNQHPDGWEIIYHRAHALLAAQIAGFWRQDRNSNKLYETIAAIAHHDDLEKEWEGDQLTPAGAPLDFTLERENEIDQLERHAHEALYKGRWVAMLISMHLCFLNQGKEGTDPEVDNFLQEQRRLQEQWRDELDLTKDETLGAYDFMRWCDRLSLILCQKQIPVGGRKLEIITDYKGQSYEVSRSESGNLTVDPWPFEPDQCCVSVDACYLDQLKFTSNEELTEALKTAPRRSLSWTFAQTQ
jgi:hypothetical protein